MILNVSLDLPGDSIYLRVARHISRTLMEDLGVVEPDIDDMEFVLGELCSNVIRHAQTTDGRFTITMQYFADKAILTVEDKGVGFAFKDVREIGTIRPDFHGKERIGGFGLDLVRQLSDRLEFLRSDSQGTTVQAEKELHYKTKENAREAAAMDHSTSSKMHVTTE
jgi:serine/threonine-protein kinase RsbW